jgi:hypothetical protein
VGAAVGATVRAGVGVGATGVGELVPVGVAVPVPVGSAEGVGVEPSVPDVPAGAEDSWTVNASTDLESRATTSGPPPPVTIAAPPLTRTQPAASTASA